MTDQSTIGHVEEPVFFDSGRDTLFGIVTSPSCEPNGVGVVLVNGGAWTPSVNRNRMWVKVARELARHGYHVIRYEYHGCGESTGRLGGFDLGRRFTSGVAGAASVLETRGVSGIVLVGTCFGGRLALRAASRLHRPMGLVLISPPVYDYERAREGGTVSTAVRKISKRELIRQFLDWGRYPTYMRMLRGRFNEIRAQAGRKMTGRPGLLDLWVGARFLGDMRATIRRRLPVLIAWGDEDPDFDLFQEARAHRFGELERLAGNSMKIEMRTGPLHLFLEADSQDWVIQNCPGWLAWLVATEKGEEPETSLLAVDPPAPAPSARTLSQGD